MPAPLSTSGIGTPTQHTECIDCGIRLVSGYYYRWNMPPAEKAHHGTKFAAHSSKGRCGKCARRVKRGGLANVPPGVEVACPHCARTTVSYYVWRKAGTDERAKIRAAGKIARTLRDGTCTSCHSARRDGRGGADPFEPIAYEGGWVNRRGVQHPLVNHRATTEERCL